MFFFFDNFESVVLDILKNADIDTSHDPNDPIENIVFDGFDYIGIRDDIVFGIDIKNYTTIKASFNTINQSAKQLMMAAESLLAEMKLVMIVSCMIDDNMKERLGEAYPDILFIDIANLLYAVNGDEELRNNLISSLSYTIDDVEPAEGPLDLSWFSHGSYTENLIGEMKLCTEGKTSFRTYEKLCHELLKNAFSNDLTLWKEQQKSNSELYRFDLICRIKEDNEKAFWSIIERFFNSKYVIFEFKNYTKPISQKEIYTTEKYLYAKALRSVAIIIAANGYDDNARWAAKGAFRENGKLILLLDTDDLIKMNELKLENEDPSAYLLDQLDSLLLELEK